MATPKWAADIVRDVCFLADVEEPRVVWRRVKRVSSSGRSWSAEDEHERAHLAVSAGTDRTDAKLVLLHELAHWTGAKDETHSAAFWDRAWALYRYYGVPVRVAVAREGAYKAGAIAGARRAGIRVSEKRAAAIRARKW